MSRTVSAGTLCSPRQRRVSLQRHVGPSGRPGRRRSHRRDDAGRLRKYNLYYTQPIGSADILGKEIIPNLCVNIGEALVRKERMLACHESQQSWLLLSFSWDGVCPPGRSEGSIIGRQNMEFCGFRNECEESGRTQITRL